MNMQRSPLQYCWLSIVVLLSLAGACCAAEPALQVKRPDGSTFEFSIDVLKKLAQTSVKLEESPGTIVEFQGVVMYELLKAAGAPFEKNIRGAALKQYVIVQAVDGYRTLFALTETDPAFSDREFLLAYTKNGQPLSASEGPLRLIIPAEKRHARWVRQISRIEVRQAD